MHMYPLNRFKQYMYDFNPTLVGHQRWVKHTIVFIVHVYLKVLCRQYSLKENGIHYFQTAINPNILKAKKRLLIKIKIIH